MNPQRDDIIPLTKEERQRLEQWAQATLRNIGLTLDKVQRLADPFKPLHMRLFIDASDLPRGMR